MAWDGGKDGGMMYGGGRVVMDEGEMRDGVMGWVREWMRGC